VGKLLPEDLYVHKSVEDRLPALLRLVLFAARQIVGDVDYDLVKVATDGRKVSFLRYPGFDEMAHPALESSLRVYLPTISFSMRDYVGSENPPILHRKETFIDPLDPAFGTFAELTRAEEVRASFHGRISAILIASRVLRHGNGERRGGPAVTILDLSKARPTTGPLSRGLSKMAGTKRLRPFANFR